MTTDMLSANWTSEGLLIAGMDLGSMPGTFKGKPWKVTKLDTGRIMAYAEATESNPAQAQGVAKCSVEMLYDLMIGINHRRWTGMLRVDSELAHKKLYFNSGEFVFASSDLIDDRLGEVIYRDAVISLDQLTTFAVQVDRKTKFGQVLLRSGRFTNTDLWNALKSQVHEILRSVFLIQQCYVEVQPGSAPVEVSFEQGTDVLIESAFSFGAQFRGFCARMTPETNVILVQPSTAVNGTFLGDIVELCKDSSVLESVVARSKLTKMNTLLAIQKLVANGQVQLEGLSEPVVVKIEGGRSSLKSRIDGYQMLHRMAADAFLSTGSAMPFSDLSNFALGLNTDGGAAIYLDGAGALTADAVSNVLQQCASNANRLRYFEVRIESLTRYLLQMAGDLLPFEAAKKIKSQFKEIAS